MVDGITSGNCAYIQILTGAHRSINRAALTTDRMPKSVVKSIMFAIPTMHQRM